MTLCSDIVVQSLFNYVDETDEQLSVYLQTDSFEYITISRWVADELMNALYDKPFENPIDIFEKFALKMISYRVNAEGESSERVFAIAAKIALEWLDIIIKEDE